MSDYIFPDDEYHRVPSKENAPDPDIGTASVGSSIPALAQRQHEEVCGE